MFENENDFKNIVEQLNIDTQPNDNHRENLRRQILSTFNRTGKLTITTWLTLRTMTKLAAAAAIIVAAVLAITFLQKSATPAYALEQTIKAVQGIRYIHTKYFDASYDEVAKQTWIEFDNKGEPKNVRIYWSKPFSTSPTIVVWSKYKTQVWHPQKNRLFILNDELYTQRIHIMAEKSDPRKGVQKLYDRASKGEVKIEVEEQDSKEDPIIVTGTTVSEKPKRFVIYVDQATKLITSEEWYVFEDGEYEYQGVMEYHDYNVPIDANMFRLEDEIPVDAQRIDARTQDIGLAQGNLTDKEIAVEVVRELLQALIAKDYAKAGQICGGLTANEIQNGWGKLNVVRIVSIGEPGPPSKPSKVFPKMQSVAYTIESEKNGKKITQERCIAVKRVLGRRDRWIIHGGGSCP